MSSLFVFLFIITLSGTPTLHLAYKKTLMATRSKVGLSGEKFVEPVKKKSRQGAGQHTKYSATSSNKAKKRYRGQGK